MGWCSSEIYRHLYGLVEPVFSDGSGVRLLEEASVGVTDKPVAEEGNIKH